MPSPSSQAGLPTRYNMRYVWAISLVAALGGLMFGYDWVVIGGTKPFYERFFAIATAWQDGWAMGGAWSAAARCRGLRQPQRQVRPQAAADPRGLCVSRLVARHRLDPFVSGPSICGGSAAGWPSEWPRTSRRCISPRSRRPAVRGRLVTMYQFTIVIGILLAEVVNLGVANVGSTIDKKAVAGQIARHGTALDAKKVAEDLAWQVPIAQRQELVADFCRLAATRQGTLDFEAVESLVENDQRRAGEEGAAKEDRGARERIGSRRPQRRRLERRFRLAMDVRHYRPARLALLPLAVLRAREPALAGEKRQAATSRQRVGADRRRSLCRGGSRQHAGDLVGEIEKVNFRDLLDPRMFKIMAIGVTLAVLQQWCGINVIFYYATDIFRAAGASVDDALLEYRPHRGGQRAVHRRGHLLRRSRRPAAR